MNTKFFTFRQNNSGGSFDHYAEEGIGIAVFIEAENLNHALDRAERIGLYFNGCETGRDCSCCGDRWSVPWSEGTDQPELCGDKFEPCAPEDEPYIYWGAPSYVHFIGGEFKPVKQVRP